MANTYKPITGIILAGGKSARMGFDKGMAKLNGKPMVAWVIAALQGVCNHIIIISNTENYEQLGYPVYADLYKNAGPLGGIFTGLTHTSSEYNLVAACDMPFINTDIFNLLLKFASNHSIVVPSVNSRFEPLCAFYHKDTRHKMEELLLQKIWKMQEVIREFTYKEIKVEDLLPDTHMFANINTPSELKQISADK
jgi:molybdopterin-guanine dinucleotide biosynthesis protein A